jgi:hypothetical protein
VYAGLQEASSLVNRACRSTLFWLATVLLALAPGAAAAQGPPDAPGTGVQIETKQRRVIVTPRADAAVIERDVRDAIGALEASQLRRRALEETIRPRRPDLGQDVTGGIQTRNLNRLR